MSNNIANIIQVDKDTRYLVAYEWDSDFDWVVGSHLGVQALQVANNVKRIHTTDTYYEAYARIVGTVMPDYNVGGWDKVSRIFTRYLTLCGVANRVIQLQGYSQGEWCEVIVYLADEDGKPIHNEAGLSPYIDALEDWWRGDVYRVEKQQRVEYTSADGRVIERWETDEDANNVSSATGDINLEWCQREVG